MDTFYSLNKLLSTLPFSILGYFEHEKELDDFFERLCESDFISKKSNIELLSYSYAKLENLNEWETKSLSSGLFFHALNEKYSLLALHVYFLIRNKLFDRNQDEIINSPHLSNNVAIVLSRLFLKDVGFRLCYTEEKTWHFSFLEQNRIFSIKVPLERIINTPQDGLTKTIDFFKNALGKFLADSLVLIKSEEALMQLPIQKIEARKSSYKIIASLSSNLIDSQFEEFIKVFKSKQELETLRNEFVEAIYFWHLTNPGYLTINNTKEHIENWVELFLPIIFISVVYNSWIEYFPSICGLDERDGRKYRNLGGLILGYRIDENNTLTQEERSIFRIISSRISSTVAGQWMHTHNKEIRRKAFQKEIKVKYNLIKNTTPAEPLHAATPVSCDQYSAITQIITDNIDIFSQQFTAFLEMLKNENLCHISKYCLLQLKENEYCDCNINNPIHQFSNPNVEGPKCHHPIGNMELINIPFISGLFSKLTESKQINGGNITCTINNKAIANNAIIFDVTYSENFPLEDFYTKLRRSHNGDLIQPYFISGYSLLDAHGIFKIVDKDDKELFNSREMINIVNGSSLILNETGLIQNSSDLKNLKLIFINELI